MELVFSAFIFMSKFASTVINATSNPWLATTRRCQMKLMKFIDGNVNIGMAEPHPARIRQNPKTICPVWCIIFWTLYCNMVDGFFVCSTYACSARSQFLLKQQWVEKPNAIAQIVVLGHIWAGHVRDKSDGLKVFLPATPRSKFGLYNLPYSQRTL